MNFINPNKKQIVVSYLDKDRNFRVDVIDCTDFPADFDYDYVVPEECVILLFNIFNGQWQGTGPQYSEIEYFFNQTQFSNQSILPYLRDDHFRQTGSVVRFTGGF